MYLFSACIHQNVPVWLYLTDVSIDLCRLPLMIKPGVILYRKQLLCQMMADCLVLVYTVQHCRLILNHLDLRKFQHLLLSKIALILLFSPSFLLILAAGLLCEQRYVDISSSKKNVPEVVCHTQMLQIHCTQSMLSAQIKKPLK